MAVIMNNTRRGFLTGLGALFVTAPAIVKATSIMPVKVMQPLQIPGFPEMAFSIEKVTVAAKSRQLKANWTMELEPLESDFEAIHSIEAEDYITESIRQQIDADIRNQMLFGDKWGVVTNNVANDSVLDAKAFDPVLISMIRRSMPNLIAYDICGVQPMTAPIGSVFATRKAEWNKIAQVDKDYQMIKNWEKSIATS
jgi:hypothetical protein